MRFTGKASASVGAVAALVRAAWSADAHWVRWGGGLRYHYAPPPVAPGFSVGLSFR